MAHARSRIAAEIETGIVVVIGPEHHRESDLARTLDHLPRADLVTVRAVEDLDGAEVGITTTPYLLVVDERRVRLARPIASGNDVVDALAELETGRGHG